MASKKNKREIRFALSDEDYGAFGRYRIMYTAGGRKLVNRQRITYLISGICILWYRKVSREEKQKNQQQEE